MDPAYVAASLVISGGFLFVGLCIRKGLVLTEDNIIEGKYVEKGVK